MSTYNKEYYESHKQAYKEASARYYAKNRDSIIEKSKERYIIEKIPVTCECGVMLFSNTIDHHRTTKKHRLRMLLKDQ
jgi:hypothetical protein